MPAGGRRLFLSNSSARKSLFGNGARRGYLQATPVGNGLLNSLLSFWTLNEASGNRADSKGSSTMIQTGSITGAAGFGNVGAVSVWNGNTANFLSAGTAIFSSGSWSVAGWFFSTNIASSQTMWGQGENGFNSNQGVGITVTRHLNVTANKLSTNPAGATTLVVSTWYFVVMTYDGTTINAYLNGSGTPEISAASTSAYTNGNLTSLGVRTAATNALTGNMVGWGVWSRVLSATDITTLYNSGNGLAYGSFTI